MLRRNKDDWRRPPPLSRLGTGTTGVRQWRSLFKCNSGCIMLKDKQNSTLDALKYELNLDTLK